MQNIKLTWPEAKEAMKEGRRVEHSHFCGGEWFEMQYGVILDEHGYNMSNWFKGEDWQEEGWSVIEEEVDNTNEETFSSQVENFMFEGGTDFNSLEILVAASFATGDTMWQTPVSRVDNRNLPSERYNQKLRKGKGHNKLKKGKKK